MSDEQLEQIGVAALGARRKMIKVFELILKECEDKVTQIKLLKSIAIYMALTSLSTPSRKSPCNEFKTAAIPPKKPSLFYLQVKKIN